MLLLPFSLYFELFATSLPSDEHVYHSIFQKNINDYKQEQRNKEEIDKAYEACKFCLKYLDNNNYKSITNQCFLQLLININCVNNKHLESLHSLYYVPKKKIVELIKYFEDYLMMNTSD